MAKPKTRSQKDSNETSSNGAESNEIESSASALDSSSTLMKRLSDAKTALEEGASKVGITKKNAKKVGLGIAGGVIGSRMDSYVSTLAAPNHAPLMAAVSATATPEVPLDLNNEGSFLGNFVSENVSIDTESVQVLELPLEAEQGTGFLASIAQTVSDKFSETTESQYGVDAVSTEKVAQAPSFIERALQWGEESSVTTEPEYGVDAVLTEVEQGPGFFENAAQLYNETRDNWTEWGSETRNSWAEWGSENYDSATTWGSETCQNASEWISETYVAAGFCLVTSTVANGVGNTLHGVGSGLNFAGNGLQALGTLAAEHDVTTTALVVTATALTAFALHKRRQANNATVGANDAKVEHDDAAASSSMKLK